MTKASDNAFPSILITEGTEPAAPAAGKQRLYIDSTTHLLKRTDSSGTDVTIEGVAAGAITSSGLTQATARLLGRTTASTGAIEEITVGSGLSLSAGSLTATGGSGGALVFLEAHTASASATLDFTSFISSTYDEYVFEIVSLIAATNTVNFIMRMGTGAGPTYDSGANYSFDDFIYRSGGTATGGAAGQTSIAINYTGTAVNNGTAAQAGVFAAFRLFDPQSTALYKIVDGRTAYFDSGGFRVGVIFRGAYESTTAVTAVRFLFSSGNITSGTIRVYGVAKS